MNQLPEPKHLSIIERKYCHLNLLGCENLPPSPQANLFDPVISQIRWNKSGPNPDPTFCYLQKHNLCNNNKQ